MIDEAAWKNFVAQWEVKGPLPVTLDVKGEVLILTTRGPSPTYIDPLVEDIVHHRFKIPMPRPDQTSVTWIRDMLRDVYLHELDEWIHVGGLRIFDPHRKVQ